VCELTLLHVINRKSMTGYFRPQKLFVKKIKGLYVAALCRSHHQTLCCKLQWPVRSLYDDLVVVDMEVCPSMKELCLMKYSVIDFLNSAQRDGPNKLSFSFNCHCSLFWAQVG
jgi:hypothetical protein